MDKKAKAVSHAMKNMERNRCTKSILIRWGAAAFGDPVGLGCGLILTAMCVCVFVGVGKQKRHRLLMMIQEEGYTVSRDYPWYLVGDSHLDVTVNIYKVHQLSFEVGQGKLPQRVGYTDRVRFPVIDWRTSAPAQPQFFGLAHLV